LADYALHAALGEIWKVVADANRYFAGEEPWKKAKTDLARMGTILWATAEALRAVSIMAQPFIPAAAAKLLDLLGVDPRQRSFAQAGREHRLAGGGALPPPSPIFPRYVEPEATTGTSSKA
jgi:methionyl-tRNA synthetase